MSRLGVKCIVCGDAVMLDEINEGRLMNGHGVYVICDECKEAILFARKLLAELKAERERQRR